MRGRTRRICGSTRTIPSAALFRQHVYVLFTLLGLSLPYRIWFARDCDDTRDGREGDKHQGEEFCEGYERGGQEVLVVVPPTVGMGILSIVDHDGEGTGIVLKEDAAIACCTTTRRNRWRRLSTDIRQQWTLSLFHGDQFGQSNLRGTVWLSSHPVINNLLGRT